MKTLGLRQKLILGFTLVSLCGMAVSGVVSYQFIQAMVYQITEQDLTNRLQSVEAAIQVSYEDNLEKQRSLAQRMEKSLLPHLSVDVTRLTQQTVENQITQEKVRTDVATMLYDGHELQGYELADRIGEQTGGTFTLFSLIPQGMVRMTTNIRKSDGSRAVGTFIPASSPVFQSIRDGKPYYGRAYVVNDWYITAYQPIQSAGKTVGAYFVGTPETSYKKIKAYLKAQKLLKTGYFYILDSKGSLVLHPQKEGQNVLTESDLNGRKIFQEILDKKNGSFEYRWLNAETGQPQSKLALFKYFPLMDWYVVASLNTAEVNEETSRLRMIILLTSCGVMLFLATMTWWFAGRISGTLDNLTGRLTKTSSYVAAKSGEILEASLQLTSASTEQASGLQENVAAIEELSATVKKNLEATEYAEKLSAKTTMTARSGAEIMSSLAEAINDVNNSNERSRSEIQLSFAGIQEISKMIAAIEEKTRVINDIVFQTKLLSFNASVEAARAGEQ